MTLTNKTHIVFNPRMTIIFQNINQMKIYEKLFSLLKYISKKNLFLNITFKSFLASIISFAC